MGERNPYEAHLCAQDPVNFEAGFNAACLWVEQIATERWVTEIYEAIEHSSNVPFEVTAAAAHLPVHAWTEGFMLAAHALRKLGEEST